jgi:hypothetical protein
VFKRSDVVSGDVVIVAVNRGAETLDAEVPAPEAWQGSGMEAVTREPVRVSDGTLPVSVPPMSIRVFTP